MIAGVAAGIGRRYGVDPVLIRVALVVSAIFGGAGVAFYLLGWLFLRDDADSVSAIESLANRGHSSVSKTLTVVLCIALIPTSGWLFGDFTTVVGAVVLFGGLYLLHVNRADYRPADTPVTDAVPPATPDPEVAPMTDDMPTVHDTIPPAADQPRTTPPTWDPLGAAPFAWDLPEPEPPAPPQPPFAFRGPVRRRRTRVTLGTIGVVFMVAALLAVGSSYTHWLSARHIVGVVVGVIGVGLVIGSFARGGRGLIPFAIVLSIVGIALTNGRFPDFSSIGSGDAHFTPTSVHDVRPMYHSGSGNITLDLSRLDNQTGTVPIDLTTGSGDIDVIVPSGADVRATCRSNSGDVTCLGQTVSGPSDAPLQASQNDTGTSSRLLIILNTTSGSGDIKVDNHG
jgi:phage shock protein PspC (stress-responsive transcriptional regulator)